MNAADAALRILLPLFCLLGLALCPGCEGAPSEQPPPAATPGPVAKAPEPAEVKKALIGPNVFLEVQGDKRRVLVSSRVCLREGQLEGLLCRKNTKEHEYILAADVDARHVHAALVASGAKAGSPVRFAPEYAPASGTEIRVSLRYQKDGKLVTLPAGQWIRDGKTKKDLGQDWVFGGSRFVPNPEDAKAPPFYLANDGDVICLCNMETAMLDLPVRSPKALDERVYQAHTERIPPLETPVVVVLEPVHAAKK